MRYCFTIIIILISFSSFPKVRTLTFFLEEGIEKCFHENLPSEAVG